MDHWTVGFTVNRTFNILLRCFGSNKIPTKGCIVGCENTAKTMGEFNCDVPRPHLPVYCRAFGRSSMVTSSWKSQSWSVWYITLCLRRRESTFFNFGCWNFPNKDAKHISKPKAFKTPRDKGSKIHEVAAWTRSTYGHMELNTTKGWVVVEYLVQNHSVGVGSCPTKRTSKQSAKQNFINNKCQKLPKTHSYIPFLPKWRGFVFER